ncbi:hypothetical protein [Paenibacillus sp. NFR01]|uniref:hypothetical protein n=1 Tax=Paenibacillus sp. NFR01 TaxID=1566279 RepID=UPI0008BBBA3E|nr:hypothetical protein [Paenibacillus sp. NFR01]SEU27919.1 hypothetical protein SAMN03159358_4637 [Paenibacillus sp. NFR01]
MSRSVKKSPACTDHRTPGTRWSKRQASKAVRRYAEEIQDGKWYRKVYCSWNICDYRFYKTKQQAIHEWETESWRQDRFPTRAAVINDWADSFRRK